MKYEKPTSIWLTIASANTLSIEEPECINEKIQIYENVSNENWEDMIINQMVEKTQKLKILMNYTCNLQGALEC